MHREKAVRQCSDGIDTHFANCIVFFFPKSRPPLSHGCSAVLGWLMALMAVGVGGGAVCRGRGHLPADTSEVPGWGSLGAISVPLSFSCAKL